MDRATLLQIFQSRLERSDYSKLQKQGRTFYQEARRQASNTQARRIFVFFSFFSRRGVLRCVPFLSLLSVPWVSAYSGLVVVLVAVVVFFIIQMRIFLIFFLIIANISPFAFCPWREFLRLSTWLHFTRIRELNGEGVGVGGKGVGKLS